MKRIASFLALSLLIPGAAVLLTPQPAQAQQVDTRIRLTGPAINRVLPEGKAAYKVKGTKRSLQVEAKANLANGTVLRVFVNGAPIGTITLSLGAGSLSLDTERRQAVPVVAPGTRVVVTNAVGVGIVSGTF